MSRFSEKHYTETLIKMCTITYYTYIKGVHTKAAPHPAFYTDHVGLCFTKLVIF